MDGSVSRFPSQLGWFCAVLSSAAAALCAWLIAAYGVPSGSLLLIFGGLAVFGMNRAVVAPVKGVSFLPHTMVVMAAIVVFKEQGTPAGPLLVGLASGLYLPTLHRGKWPWIAFNGSIWALSVGATYLVYVGLTSLVDRGLPTSLIAYGLSALTFVAANWGLVVLSYIVERHGAPSDVLSELTAQLASDVPFAIIGMLLGHLYVELGWSVMLLVIVPIVIAREMFASYIRVKESHEETVGMLIRALEAKDKYTSGHSERVATYARYMGEELNFMPARMERLRFAALMHDIGKLVVPNQLLNKPGRLTEEEFAKVRLHEKVSVQMLSHIDFLRPVAAATHGDNMKFIPDDDDHPIEPYIVMIADAYDAMTSTRSYRKALSQEVAFQELRDKAGIQFHPACVEALIGAIEKREEKHGAGYEVQDEFLDAPEAGLGSAGLGDLLSSDAQ